jgi:hypothetical protein
MSEAMALPEEELMSKLKNEITKCKWYEYLYNTRLNKVIWSIHK